MTRAKFGPAGNSASFTGTTAQVPEYLAYLGLTAYEYQCGRGVRYNREALTQMGEKARELGIALSVHAPYYISMSSLEEEKRENSVTYILQSAEACRIMGGSRIVIHTGSCAKLSRSDALYLAKDTMKKALAAVDEYGFSGIAICPETMGKGNQLGTLDEVLELCALDERLIPCIDFGHLNARENGYFKNWENYSAVFDAIENRLGNERMRGFHSHFSKIEYSAGGEKRHLTFEDTVYGPDFEPVAEQCVRRGCAPVFICESSGTQAEDAATMARIYGSFYDAGGSGGEI